MITPTLSAWQQGKPVLGRLPIAAEQYQGNPVAEALSAPIDEILVEFKAAVDNFERDFLDPDTCREDVLDWLGQLHGYTGKYWSTSWTSAQKRLLIKNNIFNWGAKGSLSQILWINNDVFNLGVQVFMIGQFLVGITPIGSPIGGERLKYFVLMQKQYNTNSQEWYLADLLNELYAPIYCKTKVCYDKFYVGLSRVGDPIMS